MVSLQEAQVRTVINADGDEVVKLIHGAEGETMAAP